MFSRRPTSTPGGPSERPGSSQGPLRAPLSEPLVVGTWREVPSHRGPTHFVDNRSRVAVAVHDGVVSAAQQCSVPFPLLGGPCASPPRLTHRSRVGPRAI